jgi:hypothetical protein
MRDAVTHLARADYADLTNRRRHPVRLLGALLFAARFGPFLEIDHIDSPYYDDLDPHARFAKGRLRRKAIPVSA